MRRLYELGLTTTSGGNISARVDENTILITPSASDKGRMTGSEIGVMDMEGNIIGDKFKPSIESALHIGIYRNRPDVNAVVHAHPVYASAFAASAKEINTSLLSESYAILGKIIYTDYYRMGSPDLASAVHEAVKSGNCVMMRNHGALAAGRTLLEAFDRLEVFEAAARVNILHMTALKGTSFELTDAQLKEIDALMGR
jgi:L-fuculose-phosphate aldolase